jgi:hypothetical protein
MTSPIHRYPLTGADKGVVPPRGDFVALRWLAAGLLCYPLFATLLFAGILANTNGGTLAAARSMVGIGERGIGIMLFLVLTGLAVFMAASVRLLRDLQKLHAEELDVTWVMERPDAAGLVFAPSARRESMYRQGLRDMEQSRGQVETLMDDRVRRIGELQRDRHVRVSPDDLRRIAEARLSALGSDGRFASGLLLLLAVLGTFAGVKAALPRLIDAVTTSAGMLDPRVIADPLDTVASAFGANSLALVGAISLGIMAHGISSGRRNLLDRLEFASEPLYRGLVSGEQLDPLRNAIDALRETSATLNDTGQAILQLDGGIADLSDSFGDAFERLHTNLAEISVQQQRALAEQTAVELQRLQERVLQMSELIDANTRLFQGLVESITTRSRESQELVAGTTRAMQRLDEGMRFVGSLDSRMEAIERGAQARLDAMQEETIRLAERLDKLGAFMERAGQSAVDVTPMLGETRRMIEQVVTAVQEHDRQMRAGWQGLAQQMGQQLRSVIPAQSGGSSFEGPTRREQIVGGLAQGVGIAGLICTAWLLLQLLQWARTLFR